MTAPLSVLQRRRARRQREENSSLRRLTRGGLGCGLIASLLTGLILLGLGLAYASLTSGLPSIEGLPALMETLRQPSRLLDRSQTQTLAMLAPQDAPREFLPLSEISPALREIYLALNDPGFSSHPGFRLENLNNPENHPTLAQRLSADLLLWDETPSLRRALRERLLAAQITQRYGRDQILAWALNTADFGQHAYGVESAARLYLGKSAREINLAEAALLAAAAQSPALNPLDTPAAAIARAREILAALPAKIASPQEIAAAQAFPYQIAAAPPRQTQAPAFTALVMNELQRDPAYARFTRGGVVIVSSLDFDLYQRAACATQTQLAQLLGAPTPPNCQNFGGLPALPPGDPLSAARASLVLLNPQNGQVLAVVGESDSAGESARLNGHRPGSSLLPFLYLTGFSRGLSPASLMWDIPLENSAAAPAQNYLGPLRARLALVNDRLPPAARLLKEMSLPTLQQTLQPLGIEIGAAADLSALLDGPNNLSPLTLARAYGALAANGTLSAPRPLTILQIISAQGQLLRGETLPSAAAIFSPQLAYLVNHVLADDTARWPTLGSPNPFELPYPSAAKLGATLDGKDNWAITYTPNRVAVIWMETSTPAPRAAAGLAAAALTAASQFLPAEDWTPPPGILTRTVCDPSGMLPSPACPALVDEVFLDGYAPTHSDTLFQTAQIDRETGLLATVFTDPGLVDERVFLVPPPEAEAWAQTAGIEKIPSAYDTLQPPPTLPGLAISFPAMFAEVSGKITVRGTASGEGFQSYRLEYGQGLNPTDWVLLAAGNTPLENGALADWQTEGLHGLYILQLSIVRGDQQLQNTAIAVTIK